MRHLSLALAVALMAACGSPNPGQNDSSTMVETDSGNPAVDASQPVDTNVSNDVPVIPEDRPVVMNDAGTPPEDVQPMHDPCWMELCGNVLVINMDGTTSGSFINCPPSTNNIGFSLLSCLGTCSGDSCTCNVEDSEGNISAIIANDRTGSVCSPEFTVTLMRNSMPMTRTSGIVRIRTM